jgi:predicted ester cyclase
MTKPVSAVAERVEYSPSVAALLAQDTAEAQLGRLFVRFAEALMDQDSNRIDAVVTADARFHELEDAGYPPGPHGFKVFRGQINAALPDEHVVIVQMRFPEPGIIETELDCTATHMGELMGNPATGKAIRFTVYTKNRFEGDRMAERWDRMDVAGLLAQLKT